MVSKLVSKSGLIVPSSAQKFVSKMLANPAVILDCLDNVGFVVIELLVFDPPT